MVTVELTDLQIVGIIVADLQESHRLVRVADKDEGGQLIDVDEELLYAIEVVLKYYMPSSTYRKWQESILEELVTKEQQEKT